MEQTTKSGTIPWMEDEKILSTTMPELIEESNQIGVIIIFVISAVLTITLLFGVAIFIDCRQQKLINEQIKKSKQFKIRVPRMGRAVRDDEVTFANKMQESSSSSYLP